jgi:hypothetical protein
MSHQVTHSAIATSLGLLFGLATPVLADAPLVGVWVELEVAQCLATTYEAPSNDTFQFIPGDKYRTALVVGRVTDAGLRPHDASKHWIQKAAERTKSNLPKKDSELSLVLRRWDKSFCQSAVGSVARFNYDDSCDTFPRTGPCLPPHRLASPSR